MDRPRHPLCLPHLHPDGSEIHLEHHRHLSRCKGKNQLLIFCVLGIMEIRKGGGANDRICEK